MLCLYILQEALAQICEYSEAGITVRGTYFPSGKQPKEEERKLYLAIEATSELAIQKAKKEVTRLIKEELIRLVSYFYFLMRTSLCKSMMYLDIDQRLNVLSRYFIDFSTNCIFISLFFLSLYLIYLQCITSRLVLTYI